MATCRAWGLTYREPASNSDKFYRVYVIGPRWIVQYGRRGAVGQFQFKTQSTNAEAMRQASDKANSKAAKGYIYDGGERSFDIPDSFLNELERHGSFLDKSYDASAQSNQPIPKSVNRVKKETAAIEEFKNKLIAMKAKVSTPTPREPQVQESNPGESQTPVVDAPAPDTMEAKLAAALAKAKSRKASA